MKSLKNIAYIIVALFIVFTRLFGSGDDVKKSTVCKNITVKYAEDVPDTVARGIAETLVESDLADGRTISTELRTGPDCYRLRTGIVADAVTPDTQATFEFFARVMTDRYSPATPIVFEAVSEDGNDVLSLMEPVAPMGNVCYYEGDFLYHSENISESAAIDMAQSLKELGIFTGDLTMARIVRTDDDYVLHLCLGADQEERQTEKFQQTMQSDTAVYQAQVFGGARTKLLACELNMNPLEGLVWIAEGLRPGQSQVRVDNIVIVHDESISHEVATAVATRFPARDESDESAITLTLSGNGKEFTCAMTGPEEHADDLRPVLGYWGREVFSEIPGVQSVKMIVAEQDGDTPFLTRDIVDGHGQCMSLKDNRIFYPANTPSTVVDALRDYLHSGNLFTEDSGFLVRLSQDAEVYTVQFATFVNVNNEDAKEFLKAVGEPLAKEVFGESQLRLELTNVDFVLMEDCVWQSDARVSAVPQPAATR